MQRLIILFLLFSSGSIVRGQEISHSAEVAEALVNDFFGDTGKVYTYNAQIAFGSNPMSGTLLIKKTQNGHRLAITTPFGNTLLDCSLNETEFHVHYVVKDLDRKLVLKTLREDFRLMLTKQFANKEVNERENGYLVTGTFDTRRTECWFEKEPLLLKSILFKKKKKIKTELTFEAKKTNFAKHILIKHFNLPLTIELSEISDD